jgi:hypothetical protein
MGVFSWLSFLLWIASVLYIRAIVADLQLCGNMMRNRHCCRRFHLVEVCIVSFVFLHTDQRCDVVVAVIVASRTRRMPMRCSGAVCTSIVLIMRVMRTVKRVGLWLAAVVTVTVKWTSLLMREVTSETMEVPPLGLRQLYDVKITHSFDLRARADSLQQHSWSRKLLDRLRWLRWFSFVF